MLTANLVVLNTVLGSGLFPNQVTVGLLVEEDDVTLPHRYVTGTLDWGDGTEPYTIEPQVSPFNSATSLQLTQQNNVLTLTQVPLAYTGTFQLSYENIANTGQLSFDATAANIQFALTPLLQCNETVFVQGAAPQWTLTFSSAAAANKITVGADTLFSPIVLAVHAYPNGNFLLEFTASNFRSPIPDSVELNQQLTLSSGLAKINNQPVIFGPILPADTGAPNANQWNFNMSTDVQVLVSNIKMILIVEPGERLMMPDYGTALRQYVFGPMDGSTGPDIEAEIRRSIGLWEPRVTINSIAVNQVDERTLSVQLTCTSKLNQETFNASVELAR